MVSEVIGVGIVSLGYSEARDHGGRLEPSGTAHIMIAREEKGQAKTRPIFAWQATRDDSVIATTTKF